MTSHDSGGQSRASRARETEDEVEADAATDTETAAGDRREKLSEDVDAILDDIDEVLENNSEEFVRGFVQKGGQ
jgi:ubiquitin-like protein Pup